MSSPGVVLTPEDLDALHRGRLPGPMTRDRARAVNRYLFGLRRSGRPDRSTPLDAPRIRGMLIEANLPVVRFVEHRFGGRPDLGPDIHQAGSLGLVKAVDAFDPGRRVEFTTYAIPVIDGEIKRLFRDTGWAARVPRTVKESASQVRRAALDLEQELGREPGTRHLAERTGRSEDDVRTALRAAAGTSAVSLDASPFDDEDRRRLTDELGVADRGFDLAEARVILSAGLRELSARDRCIVVLRFFGELSQADIGARVGLSQMQVSRLLAASLTRLRDLVRDR